MYRKIRAGLHFLILEQAELVCPPVNVSDGICCTFIDAVTHVHLSLYMEAFLLMGSFISEHLIAENFNMGNINCLYNLGFAICGINLAKHLFLYCFTSLCKQGL